MSEETIPMQYSAQSQHLLASLLRLREKEIFQRYQHYLLRKCATNYRIVPFRDCVLWRKKSFLVEDRSGLSLTAISGAIFKALALKMGTLLSTSEGGCQELQSMQVTNSEVWKRFNREDIYSSKSKFLRVHC